MNPRRPKVLILGGDGMLGHKLVQVLGPRFDVAATFRRLHGPWQTYPIYAEGTRKVTGIDAFNIETISWAIAEARPDVVINSIGIIKQVHAASDPIPSITINALFPHRLADLCAAAGARLIQISTDCVFSGRNGNSTEDDNPDPVDLYGRTKLLGELQRDGTLTLRTSIIGRDFVRRTGLLEWFLDQRGGTVSGYTNHIFSGFTTEALAEILALLITDHAGLTGLYHVAAPPISKAALLHRVRDVLNVDVAINDVAVEPCDRSLDPARFVAATGLKLPDWDEMIPALAADQTPYDAWRSQHGTA